MLLVILNNHKSTLSEMVSGC